VVDRHPDGAGEPPALRLDSLIAIGGDEHPEQCRGHRRDHGFPGPFASPQDDGQRRAEQPSTAIGFPPRPDRAVDAITRQRTPPPHRRLQEGSAQIQHLRRDAASPARYTAFVTEVRAASPRWSSTLGT